MGGNTGPDLSYVGIRHGKQWLSTWLRSPHAWRPETEMPEFRLREGALAALVDYLASLDGGEYGSSGPPWRRADAPADPAARGRLIFNKAGCVACHGADGSGGHPNNNVMGDAIPALRDTVHTYTDEELARRIRAGRTPDKRDPSGPDPLVAMPAWGKALDDDAVASLLKYLRTLKPTRTVDW